MKLHCPHCGVQGVADDAYQGQNVKCPKCLKTFIAAAVATDGQPAAPATGTAVFPELPATPLPGAELRQEPASPAALEEPGEPPEPAAPAVGEMAPGKDEALPGVPTEAVAETGLTPSAEVAAAGREGLILTAEQGPAGEAVGGQHAVAPPPQAAAENAGQPEEERQTRFTIAGILREAWAQTRGAKGPLLAGSAVMYLAILTLAAGTTLLLPGGVQETPVDSPAVTIARFALQSLADVLSVLFLAGLLYMGIRKVAGDPVSWRMIFAGFSDAGRIIVATILQSVFILIGFMILMLPGIYLAVGYSMTIPLIVDRRLSPWQAMETSRKAVHRVWWRLMGVYLVMALFFFVSMVPLGLGLIWTWPMSVILVGVVYRSLFGPQK